MRELQCQLDQAEAAGTDRDLIIDSLHKHIDTITLASSDKIKDLMAQNAEMKAKIIQMNANLDNLRINLEESQHRVMSLVTERYSLNCDLECLEAKVVYLRSRERSVTAMAGAGSSSSSASSLVPSPPASSSSAGGEGEGESTSVEMVNTLLLQNKHLLASNMAWECRYESMDLMSQAAIKGRQVLTEEVIQLKGDIELLHDDINRLEEVNQAASDASGALKTRVQAEREEGSVWRQRYEAAVKGGRGQQQQQGGGEESGSRDGLLDREKDHLIHVSHSCCTCCARLDCAACAWSWC
jgi:predicted  nucleic acid-binding Zn-ribbon protein